MKPLLAPLVVFAVTACAVTACAVTACGAPRQAAQPLALTIADAPAACHPGDQVALTLVLTNVSDHVVTSRGFPGFQIAAVTRMPDGGLVRESGSRKRVGDASAWGREVHVLRPGETVREAKSVTAPAAADGAAVTMTVTARYESTDAPAADAPGGWSGVVSAERAIAITPR